MFQLTYLWLGTMAFIIMMAAVQTRFDSETRLIFAFLATMLWAVWSNASYAIQSGFATESVRSLVYLGIILAFINLLFTVRLAWTQLADDGEKTQNPEEANQYV